jgi:hypothetical protein
MWMFGVRHQVKSRISAPLASTAVTTGSASLPSSQRLRVMLCVHASR